MRTWIMRASLTIIAFLIPTLAMAVAPYYEFNPDYSQSLLVATSDTISEVFLPLNEFLSGFDFWLSDGNQSGDATFTFYNDQTGAELSASTVTIPAIADTNTGTRFHVNLPAQHSVNGGTPYRITISSALPTLRLYYSAQNQLLAHNASPAQQYSGGLARIGIEDKAFSFTFALYESHENAAPIITNVTVGQAVIDHAVLTFNANEPVDAQIVYNGNTLNWTGTYTSCLPTIQPCTIDLPVTVGTTYSYTLTTQDVWGNASSVNGTFTSLAYGQTPTPTPSASATPTPSPSPTQTPAPPADTVGPAITNTRVVDLLSTSAAFAWTTDEVANGTIVVQLAPELITAGGNSDSTLELEHYVTVGKLTPDTFYQATITSGDSSNNKSTVVLTFLTPKNASSPSPQATQSAMPTSSPVPSVSSSPTPGSGAPGDTPDISWPAPAAGEPSNGYRIDIFDSGNHLVKTISVPAGTHHVAITGVPSGDQRVIVYANKNGVYQKVIAPQKVSVHKKPFLEQLLLDLPYILGGFIALIGTAIAIAATHAPAKPASPAPPTFHPEVS